MAMRGTRPGTLASAEGVDACPVAGCPVVAVPFVAVMATSASSEQAMSASGNRRCQGVTVPGSSVVRWPAWRHHDDGVSDSLGPVRSRGERRPHYAD